MGIGQNIPFGSPSGPGPNSTPYRIVPSVQIVVNIAGSCFRGEGDTMREAEQRVRGLIEKAIEEHDAQSDRMEDFLAAR